MALVHFGQDNLIVDSWYSNIDDEMCAVDGVWNKEGGRSLSRWVANSQRACLELRPHSAIGKLSMASKAT